MLFILGSIFCFLYAFFKFRSFISGVKRYQLNNSAYKKRKKSESFKDWLFLSKYKEEIPKILRIYYFLTIVIHSLTIIISILLCITKQPIEIQRLFLRYLLYYTGITAELLLDLLFWKLGHREPAYERWITKKRGQTKKKKTKRRW